MYYITIRHNILWDYAVASHQGRSVRTCSHVDLRFLLSFLLFVALNVLRSSCWRSAACIKIINLLPHEYTRSYAPDQTVVNLRVKSIDTVSLELAVTSCVHRRMVCWQGKGAMTTYWLLGEDTGNSDSPAWYGRHVGCAPLWRHVIFVFGVADFWRNIWTCVESGPTYFRPINLGLGSVYG